MNVSCGPPPRKGFETEVVFICTEAAHGWPPRATGPQHRDVRGCPHPIIFPAETLWGPFLFVIPSAIKPVMSATRINVTLEIHSLGSPLAAAHLPPPIHTRMQCDQRGTAAHGISLCMPMILLHISARLAKASSSGLMQLKSRRNPKDMLEWPACHFLPRHMSPKLSANAVIDLLIAAPSSLQLKSSQKVEYAGCLRETQASKGCKRKCPCDIKLYGRSQCL